MKLPILLLATFGEWLEANAWAIVVAVVGWLISMGGLVWKISKWAAISEETGHKVEALTLAFRNHENDLEGHVKDTNVHTTLEQRQAINFQLTELGRAIKGLASKEDLKELKSDIREWVRGGK